MSTTLTTAVVSSQSSASADWSAIGERLVAAFPDCPREDVLTELALAYHSAGYVGTAASELADVVELMVRYAMKVRSGEVTPSSRLDPERHAPPRRSTEEEA